MESTSLEAVFIQAGVENPYGHPAWEVVKRWKNSGANIHSTHEGLGYVLITDDMGFEINLIEN